MTTPPNFETESRDAVLVEFNDLDHPWEPVPPDMVADLLRRHQAGRRDDQQTPPPSNSPTE